MQLWNWLLRKSGHLRGKHFLRCFDSFKVRKLVLKQAQFVDILQVGHAYRQYIFSLKMILVEVEALDLTMEMTSTPQGCKISNWRIEECGLDYIEKLLLVRFRYLDSGGGWGIGGVIMTKRIESTGYLRKPNWIGRVKGLLVKTLRTLSSDISPTIFSNNIFFYWQRKFN